MILVGECGLAGVWEDTATGTRYVQYGEHAMFKLKPSEFQDFSTAIQRASAQRPGRVVEFPARN